MKFIIKLKICFFKILYFKLLKTWNQLLFAIDFKLNFLLKKYLSDYKL